MQLSALLLVAALAAAGSVQAQTPGGGSPPSAGREAARAAVLKACDADIKSLCANQQGRQVMMCLRNNADKLGADCKDAMSKLRRPTAPAAPPQ
jgi:hypothetical protein